MLPASVLYAPAAQAVHVPPAGPSYPELHKQAAAAELELGEFEFAGHARHVVAAVAPVVLKYVPAAQGVHAAEPASLEYVPTAHDTHTLVSVPVATCVDLPAAQGAHAASLLAPSVGAYLPAGQIVHAADPAAAEYVPAAQDVHVPVKIPLPPPGHTCPHETQQLLHVPNPSYGMQLPSQAAPRANNQHP
jgi:hypothetical protein